MRLKINSCLFNFSCHLVAKILKVVNWQVNSVEARTNVTKTIEIWLHPSPMSQRPLACSMHTTSLWLSFSSGNILLCFCVAKCLFSFLEKEKKT